MLRRRGAAALRAKKASGRPPKLDRRQKRSLSAALLRGATAAGFATDLWTCPRIAQLIRRRWGVDFHVDYLPRLMASLGFSCQKPQRRALERDAQAVERWVRRDWTRIKKKSPGVTPI
jgi:transposase